MKKLLALLLVLVMLVATLLPAFAEEDSAGDSAGAPAETTEPAEGDSEGDSAGDSAGEEAAPAEEGDSAGDSAAEPAAEEPVEEEPAEEEPEEEPAESAGSPGLSAEEQAAQNAETERLNSPCEFLIIEKNEATGQPRLTYLPTTTILYDGDLAFKDLNKNGQIDPYEDWRNDIETRVWDLIDNWLDSKEEAGLHFCSQPGLGTAVQTVREYKNNCILFNLNGSPVIVVNNLNNIQAACEEERLGIPMTFASDREYNAFGGYLDKAHDAFGVANDPELAYKLAYIYGEAMVAVGIHVTFEPYANEIGAQYGENPEHIAAIVSQEIKGLEDAGFASCTKHWIGRGGAGPSFENARSIAANTENWMVGWKAALWEGGSEWVMTNCDGKGFSMTTDPKWDSETMGYLRNVLGFNGVVVTDWWAFRATQKEEQYTLEGVHLIEQPLEWLYARAIQLGTDVFGNGQITNETDSATLIANNQLGNHPALLAKAFDEGWFEQLEGDGVADYHESTARILRFKFKKGLFENPYRVVEEALAVVASAEYQLEQWEITTNEELKAARNPVEEELAEQLQAKAAVLLKNEGGILPLAEGVKIYFDGSSNPEHYAEYLANFGEIVEEVEDADVVIGYYDNLNDAAEILIEDAIDADKPLVLALNGVAGEAALRDADAVLYLSFSQQPDHGSSLPGFIYKTEPWVFADILFGVREPEGIIQSETARSDEDKTVQWQDLAGDMGASPYVRLLVEGLMLYEEEYHSTPNNFGDPLVPYKYSMRYGEFGDFGYRALILPYVLEVREVEGSSGTTNEVTIVNKAKAGEPFTAYCLLQNFGSDDLVTVELIANGEVIADKLFAVCGGSWRVVQIDGVLDAGEYEITIGDLPVQTLIVE